MNKCNLITKLRYLLTGNAHQNSIGEGGREGEGERERERESM